MQGRGAGALEAATRHVENFYVRRAADPPLSRHREAGECGGSARVRGSVAGPEFLGKVVHRCWGMRGSLLGEAE